MYVGLREDAPVIVGLFYDSQFEYGDSFRMWGMDELHHVRLGVLPRQGMDQVKV